MFSYDELDAAFQTLGADGGLKNLINVLQADPDHHAFFRALLLQKRYELGLPLIAPGDLDEYPESARKDYEAFVETTCRETGLKYLNDKNIVQAWRYFRTLGEKAPIRKALEALDPKDATDEELNIALDQGVHVRRGFEIALQRDGLCRAISTFDAGFSTEISDKKYAAGLLLHALYKDLVVAVCREIHNKFGETPPETDLVDLIRHRPWLFEDGRTHADPQHVASVSRIGLLAEGREELIMALSICEYGRMLAPQHRYSGRPPFEGGFDDWALYARALLGQNVETTIEHFRSKLSTYDSGIGTTPAEMVVLLLWRTGQKEEALSVWQHYLFEQAPEVPGEFIPSYYELCIQARQFQRLVDSAKVLGDTAAWAAARIMENTDAKPATVEKVAVKETLEGLS